MELPLRAPADATIKAVHCREGELVQPDAVLVEFEQSRSASYVASGFSRTGTLPCSNISRAAR